MDPTELEWISIDIRAWVGKETTAAGGALRGSGCGVYGVDI